LGKDWSQKKKLRFQYKSSVVGLGGISRNREKANLRYF
jgi:hypothetical protein